MRFTPIAVLSAAVFLSPFSAGVAESMEETDYTVVYKSGRFEIRRYEPHIVAETMVEGDFDEAGNIGFRRLFDYISGNNRSRQGIEMTAPVTRAPKSEKIEMTAPVTQEKQAGRFRITFLMPSRFSMQTLPQPLNEKVRLKQVPGRRVAAIRYSGTWSRQRYKDHEKQLLQWVFEQGLQPEGDPVFARYNAPFIPWFLRRNEVLIPVQKPGEDARTRIPDAPSAPPQ